MHLTFTFTEHHPEPEREAIWILTADLVWHSFNEEYGRNDTGYYIANIQSALTHEGPVKISDINPELLAEMEQAAIAWVSEGRESLQKMLIWQPRADIKYFEALVKGLCVGTELSHERCFNFLLQHINTPQTQS